MLLRVLAEYAAAKVYAPVFEVLAHKYVLHGLGKDKESKWSFHYHRHHKTVRKNGLLEEDYYGPILANPSALKEIEALAGAVALHLPLAPFFPVFVATISAHAVEYYIKHYRCHTDPEWAFEHLPHHVKHHVVDQDANWGVTSDWVDKLIGTATNVDPEEWERLREFYLKRAELSKPKIEEMAAQREKEIKQKFQESLEGLTLRLYSYLPSALKPY